MGLENNTISSFTTYLENLCRFHKSILHREEEKHFVRLCADEQLTARKTLCMPIVCLEKLTVAYGGKADSINKHRIVELMFLDNISNASDYNAISQTWDRMERLADDFLLKMKADQADRIKYPFLRNFSIPGASLDYVEAIGTLWGVLLSFEVSIPFSECVPIDPFYIASTFE